MSDYQITPNNYVEPEVRPEVVQRMLDYFVNNADGGWKNEYRPKGYSQHYGLCKWRFSGDEKWKEELWGHRSGIGIEYKDEVCFRTCEVKELFKIWLGAGYFISKCYDRGCPIYKFTSKPYLRYDYKLVTEFTENID